jgi:hypothetical protein
VVSEFDGEGVFSAYDFRRGTLKPVELDLLEGVLE